ncbi:protein kinase domain-containing protein [Nostoc sp.]|uniref:protein kinase domain-containing protein n=1 Tax=Nostoc sp. TaxID=1180 RepID=UPI002FFA7545
MQTLLNNRYRVIQTLESGGFGETFLAEDTHMPSNRRCVIKQLRPIQNNPQIYQLVQERFRREAAILEDLGGATKQIPTLYAYLQLNGQFYLVQEWIEGDTLTKKVHEQGSLSESAVKEILVSLLSVIEYVHNQRIIHRDIKPDNIILRHRDRKPVLIDFGAIRETMGTVVNSQGNPTSSIVIGTPGYMPSEQAAGRPIYSSDLYSLGITAIYLLTGKQPQELETDPSIGEILWHKHALSVSQTIIAVIDRAIAFHPRDRFATAKEMLKVLQFGAGTFSPTVAYIQPPAVTAPSARLQKTVSVSPAPSYQPAHQNSRHREIFLPSLIVGSLIGGSIIIGFALSKSPQSVVQSRVLSESSPTRDQVQNTLTPAQSLVSITPQPTISKEPQAQEVSPVRSQFPSNNVPSPTQSAQLPSSTEPQNDRTTPEQAVKNYFEIINKRDFQTGWNQLSPSYQNNKRRNPDGYLSYIDWWGRKVESVDIEQVSLVEATAQTATVNAKIKYLMNSRKVIPGSIYFFLLWDAQNSRWIVSDTK